MTRLLLKNVSEGKVEEKMSMKTRTNAISLAAEEREFAL